MHHRRAGGQRQHSELLTLSPKSDRIQNAIAYAEKHLNTELSVGKLAQLVPVTIGRGSGENVEIVSGLKTTDDVITDPSDSLIGSTIVQVEDATQG
jgi:multidrug efflux pump subunit AcrA (membrane-fusion protein)